MVVIIVIIRYSFLTIWAWFRHTPWAACGDLCLVVFSLQMALAGFWSWAKRVKYNKLQICQQGEKYFLSPCVAISAPFFKASRQPSVVLARSWERFNRMPLCGKHVQHDQKTQRGWCLETSISLLCIPMMCRTVHVRVCVCVCVYLLPLIRSWSLLSCKRTLISAIHVSLEVIARLVL